MIDMPDIVSSSTSRGMFVGIELTKSPLLGIQLALINLRTKGIKSLMLEIGQYWHRVIMPKHFAPGNWQLYNMEPRQPDYLSGKKRRYGIGVGKYFLGIFRGETLRRITHQTQITATSHQATIRMNTPTYFHTPSSRGDHPDQPAELLQVNARDLFDLHAFAYHRLYEMSSQMYSNIQSRAA